MANFTAGTSFTDGVTNDVTAAKLNALVADATPTANLSLNSTTGTIANFTSSTVNATLGTLTTGVIGTGTFGSTTSTAATITSGTIPNLTAGTTISTVATITTGTIPTLTAGTTISTAATITTGTIPTLTAGTTTSTSANITSATITTGTIPTLTIGSTTATAGTITTLNSTTGTITNLSTTLTGDMTISQGTATAGTRLAVLNTAQQYSRAHNFSATSLAITSGTIPWDLSQNQVASLSVTTNSTLNNPTNAVNGATYVLIVTQGTAGNNTLSFGTAYKFPGGTAPSLSTGSSQVDVLSFVSNGTLLYGVTSQNFS